MLRSSGRPPLRHILHETTTRIATVLLTSDGFASQLTLTHVRGPLTPGHELVFDPFAVGLLGFDEAFRCSVEFAVPAARQGLRELTERAGRKLDHLDEGPILARLIDLPAQSPALHGPSAGGAFAVGVMAVATRRPVDQAVISLAVEQDETEADPAKRWSLRPVGGLAKKASALRKADLTPLIVSSEQASQLADAKVGLEVVEVRTLVEAYDRLTGLAGSLVAALRHLAWRALDDRIPFLPARLKESQAGTAQSRARAILDFLLPTLVYTQREWESYRTRCPSTIPDDDYAHVASEAGQRDEKQKPPTPQNLTTAIPGLSLERWLLLGEPGEGKTTALVAAFAQRCLDLADAIEAGRVSLDGDAVRLPLFLPCEAYQASGRGDLLAQARRYVFGQAGKVPSDGTALIDGHTPPPAAQRPLDDWVRRKCDARQVWLGLDAFDERPPSSESVLTQHVRSLERVPMLISSRYSGQAQATELVDRSDTRTLRVAGLDPGRIRQYLDRYFPPGGEQAGLDPAEAKRRLDQALRSAAGQLACVPLMLALLAELAAAGDELPTTRTAILTQIVRRMFVRTRPRYRTTHGQPESRIEAKTLILLHLAWEAVADRPLPTLTGKTAREVIRSLVRANDGHELEDLQEVKADEILQELVIDGLLVKQERRGESYRFILKTIHEWAVAGYVATRSEAVRVARPDPAVFATWVAGRADAWGRDEEATGWSNRDQTDRLPFQAEGQPDWIKPLNQPGWEPIWPMVAGWLEVCRGRVRARHLIDAILTEDEDVLHSRLMLACRCLAEAPTAIPAEDWLGRATALFDDPLTRATGGAALAASRRGEAAAPLIKRLGDNDKYVRWAAARALGFLEDASAVLALIERLGDESESIRRDAAKALGRLRDASAVPALIERLGDEDEEVRGDAAEALGLLVIKFRRRWLTGGGVDWL